jgi:DNA replication licensing factor MCM2
VINSHINSHPHWREEHRNFLLLDQEERQKDIIPQHMLRKYIMYARKYTQPKLSDLNKNKLAKFYAELRKESELVGGMTIAVRHLESLIRMSEAHAKMHLRDYIRAEDIDVSIKVMLESFLQSQKTSIAKNLKRKFVKYITEQEDHAQLLLNVLTRLTREQVKIL